MTNYRKKKIEKVVNKVVSDCSNCAYKHKILCRKDRYKYRQDSCYDWFPDKDLRQFIYLDSFVHNAEQYQYINKLLFEKEK